MSYEASIKLSDGRKLAYMDYGPKLGWPVFLFHGTPGCRLEYGDLMVLTETNIRLIVADRPGFGLSDFKQDRTLLDWPDDVVQLADYLELESIAVLGFSGGGPYAAACAYKVPQRITRVGLVSSLSSFDQFEQSDNLPPNYPLYELAKQDYRLAEQQIIQMADSNDAVFQYMEASVAEADKKQFNDTAFRQMYKNNLIEACRQGYTGLAYDMSVLASPWGFNPEQIQPETFIWHGHDDANVSIAMGQYLGKNIPHCHAKFVQGTGHYLMFEHWQEILQELAG